MNGQKMLVSIVLPLYNEEAGLLSFHEALSKQLTKLADYEFEIIYCNDGSTDGSLAVLQRVAQTDKRLRIITLSRNFGKEIATTAGLQVARGKAIITLDSDGQHPVDLLPGFIEHWQSGAKVVVGVLRSDRAHQTWFQRTCSRLFYWCINRMAGVHLVPGATDYRLIDKVVHADFIRLTERNRITRGLVDWMGYPQTYITFAAKPRLYDAPAYSFKKLMKLAVDSVISLSSSPLYVVAYIGAIVLPISVLLGLIMVLDTLLGDPFNWHATGGAYLLVLLLFLIGIILMAQGIIGLYLSHIHNETQNRPLYIVDKEASHRL